MSATPEQLEFLRRINSQVNAIPYVELPTVDEPTDFWIDAPEPGHTWQCRDYTINKAVMMRQQGWDHMKMGVVLCWIEPEPLVLGGPPVRQYHAVQFASATGDIFILDNRTADIYLWNQPPLQFAYPTNYLWAHQQIPGTTSFRNAGVTGLI